MSGGRGGHVMVAAAAASWGTWSLFLRPAARLGPLAPELVALLLQASLLLVSAPLLARQPRRGPRPAKAWALLGALGVSDALNGLLFFKALSLTTVAIAVLTHSLAPLLVAALSPLLTGERAQRRTWGCLLLALGGLGLLLEPWRTPAQGVAAGAAAGAASAVFYAFNVLSQKRLSEEFSAPEINSYHAVVSALVLGAVMPAGGWALAGPGQAALVGAAALLVGGVSSLVFLEGLRRVPASHAATLVLLEPAVAVLVGVLVWREPLGPLGAAGGLLVLGALLGVVAPGSVEKQARAA